MKGTIIIQNNTSVAYLYESGYFTIPLDDDCGISFSVINSSGQITLRITSDNSDAETAVLRYYSQLYTGF